MKKVKFEKVYDYDGDLRGYKLGEWYLLKSYGFGGTVSWMINRTGEWFYYDHELYDKVTSGELEFVSSFKEGKQILIKRYEA